MTQNEVWDAHLQEIKEFVEKNKRRPSKYRKEELRMVYWIKYCKKLINQDRMNEARKEKFLRLMEYVNKFQRKNQYEYTYINEENVGITLEQGKYSQERKMLRRRRRSF